MNRRTLITLGTAVAAAAASSPIAAAATERGSAPARPDSDLAGHLPGGFRSRHANVNGTTLHYVEGGQGEPLFLLPGWPQTWWSYHKVMPALAEHFRVFAIDIRGMGGSAKPQDGYDKKTMAQDVYALAQSLGYSQVNIAGHDIGSMVAFSFAANHPEATKKAALLAVSHPDDSLYTQTLLPEPGQPFFLWWFAFNQVHGLPEQLITGRARYLVDWMFDYLLHDKAAISDADRALYAAAYDYSDAIRAGNGWYQGFVQDIVDAWSYGKLTPPILAMGDDDSYDFLVYSLTGKAVDLRTAKITDSGHFMLDEQPEASAQALISFFS